MKKLFKISPLLLIIITLLTGCTSSFHSYEDKLYSERVLLVDQTSPTQTSNVLTRENAIKKALEIFNKGFNTNIDRTQFSENVRLLKTDSSPIFQWLIMWNKKDGKNYYNCTLNSATGDLVELEASDASIFNNVKTTPISSEDVKNILEPLFKQLNLDVNDYSIEPISSDIYNLGFYEAVYFTINKFESSEIEYYVTINAANEYIRLDKKLQ